MLTVLARMIYIAVPNPQSGAGMKSSIMLGAPRRSRRVARTTLPRPQRGKGQLAPLLDLHNLLRDMRELITEIKVLSADLKNSHRQ